jgi:hypothetical protein
MPDRHYNKYSVEQNDLHPVTFAYEMPLYKKKESLTSKYSKSDLLRRDDMNAK